MDDEYIYERVYGRKGGKIGLYDEFLNQTLGERYPYQECEPKNKKRFENSNCDDKPTAIKALLVFSCFL